MKGKHLLWTAGILVLLGAAFIAALAVGRYHVSAADCLRILLRQTVEDRKAVTVVTSMRLPRAVLAVTAGAGLAAAGAAFQSMFSNPLATPDTLGVATGASFGATLGILLGFRSLGIQALAFVMGLAAVALVYTLSRIRGNASLVMLILSGLVIGALFEALVSLMKYIADPQDVLPEITYWLLGSMSGTSFRDLAVGLPPILFGIAVLFILRWKMNILSLQEDEARALGVNLKLMRGLTIIASTMITGSVIAICGKVGWIGILVPHVARMIFGNNNKYVIPASIGLGAVYLLVIDTVARSVTTAEIPLSILTAILGAPLFIVLLRRTGGIRT